ncbi:MAG: hypothetical protein SF162_01070 [bacterium]|nr:hypothetical protein [bacterium]
MFDQTNIPDVEQLLDQLEQLAPTRDSNSNTRSVIYRISNDDEPINDAISNDDAELQDWIDWQEHHELPFIWEVNTNNLRFQPVPLTAVDTGLIRLGETEDGLIIALRGTIISVTNSHPVLNLYRTGPIYLRNTDKAAILHILGTQLGKPDMFVELDDKNIPIRVKSGVADNVQAYSDRFRNWFERVLQKLAIRSIQNGIVLLDGALTTNTYDTPTVFFESLRDSANEYGNAVVAISKQSRLQVQNRAVRFWLSESAYQVCYRRLTDMMSDGMKQRIMGATYAIRFSPMGLTYRVDVKPVAGQREEEVIETLFASCLMRGGYPDVLVQAHAHSYFTSPHVAELEAQCGAKYALRAEAEADLGGIFGPFGGRFK